MSPQGNGNGASNSSMGSMAPGSSPSNTEQEPKKSNPGNGGKYFGIVKLVKTFSISQSGPFVSLFQTLN